MSTKGGGAPYIDPDIADGKYLQTATEDGVKVVKGVDAPSGGSSFDISGTYSSGDVIVPSSSTARSYGKISNANVASNAAIAQSKLDLSIGNSDVASDASIAQSKLNLSIGNSEVASNAAIAQSKLDLSIGNSDVASDANIAQSKLDLSIGNSDVASDANIAQSKLNLSITNSEVASDAEIAQSKLADLVESDLPSGTVVASGTRSEHDLIKAGSSGQSWGLLTNDNVDSSAAISQSKLDLSIGNNQVASNAAIAQSKLDLSISNSDVASDAEIAQSKLADLATSDLPDGTLFYTGTPAGDNIPVYNAANDRWQLEAKPSGSGTSFTVGGTRAEHDLVKATTNGQSWGLLTNSNVDASAAVARSKLGGISYEDIVRFSSAINTGNDPNNASSDNTDRTLPAGKSFADYDFLIIERKERPGGGTNPLITSHSGAFLRALAVGQQNEIIAFPNWSTTVVNGINIDIKSNTTYRFAFIGDQLRDGTGEGCSAIIGVNV